MDCLTKTIPYVAIHCCNALSLGIACYTLKLYLLEGQWVNYSTYKDLNIYRSNCLWKCWISPKYMVNHAAHFERFWVSKMFDKLALGCIWLCAPYFERVLRCKIRAKFRCERCTLKVLVHWFCACWKNIVWHTEISVFACSFLDSPKLFEKI